jgi:hypothetical protein
VSVGPNLSERLPTYLYHRGSGLNVVRNVGCVNSCLEVQSVCVDLLCGRGKLYICVCVDFLLGGARLYGCEPFVW